MNFLLRIPCLSTFFRVRCLQSHPWDFSGNLTGPSACSHADRCVLVEGSLNLFTLLRCEGSLQISPSQRDCNSCCSLPVIITVRLNLTVEDERVYIVEQRNSQRREQCFSFLLVFSEISLLFDMSLTALC
ncbi:hypothetical protein QQF64_015599 [Cirrhinus molitorella]|uniref:Secreted protein n=1 Tax=Cirrhinus molitorella TaxID=172907 RepID=A0ABR3NVQ9_9TELE